MADPRIVKLAQVLVRYSIPVQAGDWFVIRSSDLAAPLIREVFREALLVGAHVAPGAAYPEAGGLNVSSLHWDMLLDLRDGGEVFADGKLLM